MSLFNTIKTGASGLGASGSSLAVIGDNIANLNTRGYKRGRIAFADVMPQYIGTVNGTSQVGRGATTSTVNTMHLQGGFQSTGSALDMAIGGDGFFQVTDGQKNYYTRDGSFRLDKDNFVTTLGGLQLQGYPATDGVISGQPGPLQIDGSALPHQVTQTLSLTAQLAPDVAHVPGEVDALRPLDGRDANSINDVTDKGDFHTSITIYDSAGQPHDATVVFEQETSNQWSYVVVVDGSEVDESTGGGAFEVTQGTLDFGTDGMLAAHTAGTGTTATFAGADAWLPTLEFGATGEATGSITANGTDDSTAISFQQDGNASAFLSSVAVDKDGRIMGQYENGESQVLGQVALAKFGANDGLGRVGGNLYEQTLASGDPTLGVAGTGGRGTIAGYALEGSNVDLEDEFVSMIQSQRSYQANASTVRASDESLQVLVQLV